MSPSIRIKEHLIGQNHPPFIIVEMSENHNQSLEIIEAFKTIRKIS